MPDISELNRKIIIDEYGFIQDSAGGNEKILIASHPRWAKVTKTSGSRSLDQAQITYSTAFEIYKRFEQKRPELNTNEIHYGNYVLSIAFIQKVEEGKRWWEKITAYSTEQDTGGEVAILCNWYQIDW
jgi:hypothetical protein